MTSLARVANFFKYPFLTSFLLCVLSTQAFALQCPPPTTKDDKLTKVEFSEATSTLACTYARSSTAVSLPLSCNTSYQSFCYGPSGFWDVVSVMKLCGYTDLPNCKVSCCPKTPSSPQE